MIKRLISPDYSTVKDLNNLVKSICPKHSCSSITFRRHILDTYDWRIFSAGYLLEHDLINKSQQLTLQPNTSQNDIMHLLISSIPRFCPELKSSSMKSKLTRIVKARAFVSKVLFHVTRFDYEISNNIDKINLRLSVEGLFAKKPLKEENCITCYMILRPLRGYENKFKKTEQLLTKEFGFSEYKGDKVASAIKSNNEISEYLLPKTTIKLSPKTSSKIAGIPKPVSCI